jgi:hypothetical protein
MFKPIHHKSATLPLPKSVSLSPLRHSLLFVALACFALSQAAQAQDGDEGNENTAEGGGALHTYISTASSADADTAIGFSALFSNTTGNNNTATGNSALFSNTTGGANTATGLGALTSNTTGNFNTATGANALSSNNADNNTATGNSALESNTAGTQNTAAGAFALFNNTTGHDNTANGVGALESNTTASYNTANGDFALQKNTTGSSNTANGVNALLSNTIGNNNTTDGVDSLEFNTTGTNNAANGAFALNQNTSGSSNTAAGNSALNKNTTGSNNTAVGFLAGQSLTTGSNNIDIGANVLGAAGESNRIRIGIVGTQKATFIAGIHGVTVASGLDVVVGTNGQLGTITSSARFKEAIKPMDKTSEAILALKPVTFRYKHDLDPDGIPQFGLVAEEVEKVNPDLVARDADGKVYTVRYEAVNAMLLNEFLKEHRKVQDLKETVAQQQKQIAAQQATASQQQKQIEDLTATVQKVSDQVALSKPAPQLVANP